MRWLPALCLVFAAVRTAAAEPFLSVGISIGSGPRGVTFGMELSGGAVGDPFFYGGGAAGFEVAPRHHADQPWGRLYVEAEGGWALVGLGIGPAVLLGANGGLERQVTPYFSLMNIACANVEPFGLITPYYRFTTSPVVHREGGALFKLLWLPNGKRDKGACLQD